MPMLHDGGGGAAPIGPTVPLMVQPDQLLTTAQRFDAIADNLEQAVKAHGHQLQVAPAGAEEVSRQAAAGFSSQGRAAVREITTSVQELRAAAQACRTSAQQYEQHDVLQSIPSS
ncbi:PE family protein [Rhodococcus sp. X156]|uniref:PE family protein n=1 Tax=Rhodococcus sp. X156 TaxID=2499145 RepID=UPI000FD8EEA8|nr:PE family protein [Rhodococcus sp. X156]